MSLHTILFSYLLKEYWAPIYSVGEYDACHYPFSCCDKISKLVLQKYCQPITLIWHQSVFKVMPNSTGLVYVLTQWVYSISSTLYYQSKRTLLSQHCMLKTERIRREHIDVYLCPHPLIFNNDFLLSVMCVGYAFSVVKVISPGWLTYSLCHLIVNDI